MSVKLTERQALEITKQLWTWLAENPNAEMKEEWVGWKNIIPMAHHCPCCEFSKIRGPIRWPVLNCKICPLRNQWPGDEDFGGYRCELPNSPYQVWKESLDDKGRKGSALEMVVICDEALADLEGRVK